MSGWIMVLAFVCALGSWDTDSAVGAAITAGLVTL